MASKDDFSADEWGTLWKGVTGAGMLVSVADRDFTDSFGEASALAKRISEERVQGASELLRELAAGHGTGFGLTASPQKVETETLEALHAATATLAAKAPDELGGYRQFVLDVADAVAEAKGGIKPGETAAIDKIKTAVGAA
jgi:tellurite resistance protein